MRREVAHCHYRSQRLHREPASRTVTVAIASALDKPVALNQSVQVSIGPLMGLRRRLLQVSEVGRAMIQLDAQPGVWLVAPAKNISPLLASGSKVTQAICHGYSLIEPV